MDIYLLRHGQTISPGTYSGKLNIPLSLKGEEQIRCIAPFVHRIAPDICYISPLVRCRKTYELLNVKTEMIIDEALSEIDFGQWEGCTFDAISSKDKNNLARWIKEKENFTFPGGDNIFSFSMKVKEWFGKVVKTRSKKIFIISHAGVIRHGICHLLNLDLSCADKFSIDEGLVSMVHSEGDYSVLKLLNSRG